MTTDVNATDSTQVQLPAPTAPSAASRRKRILQLALQLIVGFALGGSTYFFIPKRQPGEAHLPLWQALLVPFVFAALFFFVLAFHEFGHFVGGKLAGMRFLLFIVGPLRIHRAGEAVKVGFNRSLQLAGGLCGMVPADTTNLIPRMAILVAGGPTASVVLSLVAALLLRAAIGPRDILFGLTFFSGLIALATLLPMKTGSFYTDGSRLLMLWKGGPAAERWAALASLIGQAQAGIRPRDYTPSLVDAVIGQTNESFDGVSAAITAYAWHIDRGEIDQARAALNYAVAYRESWPKPYQANLLAEDLYLNSVQGLPTLDLESRRALVAKSPTVEKYLRFRVEAAVLAYEGKKSEAQTAIASAMDALKKAPHAADFERDLLARIPLA